MTTAVLLMHASSSRAHAHEMSSMLVASREDSIPDRLREAARQQADAVVTRMPPQARRNLHVATTMTLSTMRVPSHAVRAVYSGGVTLVRSLPRSDGEQQQAWMGFAAGGVCSLASVAACGFCAWLACVELAVRTAKIAAGVLAAQLSAGASFGAAAARRDLHSHGAFGSAMAQAGRAAAGAERADAEDEQGHGREHHTEAEPPMAGHEDKAAGATERHADDWDEFEDEDEDDDVESEDGVARY